LPDRDLLTDFDPDELVMLRQLFRDEAHEALEQVTARAQGPNAGGNDAILDMMRLTHTIKGSAGTVGLNQVVDLAHQLEGALAAIRTGQRSWTTAFGDAVVEIVDGIRLHVDSFADPVAAATSARRVRDLLAPWTESPRVRRASSPVDDTTGSLPVIAAIDGVVIDEHDGAATANLPVGDLSASHESRTLLRVEPERIDELMSAAGELLFDRNRIERRVQLLRTLTRDLGRVRQDLRDDLSGLRGPDSHVGVSPNDRLRAIEGQIASLTTQLTQTSAALLDETDAMRRTLGDLQRGLTRVRMHTARALFAQLARALRAAARLTGAKVELHTRGEDTEFDKAVAEKVTDPLIQILRNAVVHGIEPSVERVLRGKSAAGNIQIIARTEGSLIVIEVSDDGRGVEVKKLRQRLVERGRWTQARSDLASDDDVVTALFDPGVSSRDEADELAGRGVGLDLVREAIARLGGEIRMTSTPGRGTTFTLRLPVSTAVTHAMLFKVHGQVYALPNAQVVDVIHVDGGAATWLVAGEPLPVVHLEQLLVLPNTAVGDPGQRRPGVVIAYADKRLVATVDKVVGPREIVVKQLGPLLAPLPLYAGATISGSGKVQLILDPAALVRAAYPGQPVPTAMPIDPARGTLSGRALVVDDSRAIREALMSMLAREGWIVDTAEDGVRALTLANELHYDLVITDLEMPRLSGLDFISRLRGDRRTAAVPIVIISSRIGVEQRRRARDLNVRAVITKPVTRRKLLDVLYAEAT
jgi:chemotaxis protein histidine kinase CheA